MKVTGKTFVVTGAASGIGRALTFQLLRQGAQVAGVDIHGETLKETKSMLSEDHAELFSLHELDVSDQSACEKLAQELNSIHGSVDGLINNAGIIQPFLRVNDLDYASIHRVFNVNFFGALYLTKAFLPAFLERPEACIVNISSMGGFVPVPGQTIYGASKAALKLLSEGLHAELMDTNVHVMVVYPGAIATNITENSGLENPIGNGEESSYEAKPAEEAATEIISAIIKDKSHICVGKDSKMLNAMYRISPDYAINTITKQMKDLLPN